MTVLRLRDPSLPKPNYTPVIAAFVGKTLILGSLLAFFHFHFEYDSIKDVFPIVQTFNFSRWLGLSCLAVTGFGVFALLKDSKWAEKLFIFSGIIFSSIMATTVLLADYLSVNGVSYCVDALVLVWIFIQLSIPTAKT